MEKDLSILNKIVGEFIVIAEAPSDKDGNAMWKVKCLTCGYTRNERGTVIRRYLRNKEPMRCFSCKRYRSFMREKEKEERKAKATRPESALLKEKYPLLYYVWKGMKRRCYSLSHPKYKYYGARGISICDEWRFSFVSFCKWSFTHGYKPNNKLSIDRIDNDGNYEPSNCRWTDYVTQANNQRHRCAEGTASARHPARVARRPKIV